MLRELDAQFAAVQQRAVESVDGVVGVSLVEVAHEREAAAVLRVRVTRDVHVAHVAVLLKHLLEHVRRRPVRQVVHLERHHALRVGRYSAEAHPGRFTQIPRRNDSVVANTVEVSAVGKIP